VVGPENVFAGAHFRNAFDGGQFVRSHLCQVIRYSLALGEKGAKRPRAVRSISPLSMSSLMARLAVSFDTPVASRAILADMTSLPLLLPVN
jgi:hypothetical protein